MDSKSIRSFILIAWDYIRSTVATLLTILSFYTIIIGLSRDLNIASIISLYIIIIIIIIIISILSLSYHIIFYLFLLLLITRIWWTYN